MVRGRCQERNLLTWKMFMRFVGLQRHVVPFCLFLATYLDSNLTSYQHPKIQVTITKSPCTKALRSSLQCGFGLPETRKVRETSNVAKWFNQVVVWYNMFNVFVLLAFDLFGRTQQDTNAVYLRLVQIVGRNKYIQYSHRMVPSHFLQNRQFWIGHYLPTSCVFLQHLWSRSLSQPLPRRNSMSRLLPRPQLRKPARFLRSTWHQWRLAAC